MQSFGAALNEVRPRKPLRLFEPTFSVWHAMAVTNRNFNRLMDAEFKSMMNRPFGWVPAPDPQLELFEP